LHPQSVARGFTKRSEEPKSACHNQEAAAKSSSREIKGFVTGLKRDQAAVEAALTYAWSNGQTEGQVNKLKNLKRSMFGRAKFDLFT
jgi:transposase